MESIFNFKSPTSQLFDIVKQEVISLAAVMFPQHFETVATQLTPAFKSLKQDMQCWIPMLQHNLLEDNDISSLITEKKYHFYFDWSNCLGIDPATVEKFADEVCDVIYTNIVTSYQRVPTSHSLLSRLYSFCISKNGWSNTGNKSRMAIV